jgi:multidrug resistance protein MdtO
MSTGWMGLGASIITCTLTARPFTGASRHRQSLRFAGFLLGAGVIGLGTEVFILPQMDTLPQFATLFAAVVWVGSWVATSGPRIAFSGFQIVLAYSLVNLNKFTINTSLVPARDQVLGIMLGVVAMWLVFDHLWAETSTTPIRTLLLGTLRQLGDFRMPDEEAIGLEANHHLTAMSSKISRHFDKLRDLADMYVFESFPKKSHESLVNRSVRTLLPELRAFLLVKTGLLQHINLGVVSERVLLQEVEERTSELFRRLVNAIKLEVPTELSRSNWNSDRLRAKVQTEEDKAKADGDRQKYVEMRLCGSLLEISSHLEWRTRLNFGLVNGDEEAVESGLSETVVTTGATSSALD